MSNPFNKILSLNDISVLKIQLLEQEIKLLEQENKLFTETPVSINRDILYVDYREDRILNYKGIDIYLGIDSKRQVNKKRIMYKINNVSKQLFGGSGWAIWIKDDILYSVGNTPDNPIIYKIDLIEKKWKQINRIKKEPYVQTILSYIFKN